MKPFENIMEKGENAGNQHFLLFPQCFLLHRRQIPPFKPPSSYPLKNDFNFDQARILWAGKSVKVQQGDDETNKK